MLELEEIRAQRAGRSGVRIRRRRRPDPDVAATQGREVLAELLPVKCNGVDRRGELTLGDSHEYGDAIEPFDNPHIDELILAYMRTFLTVPDLTIAARWHGTYVKHPTAAYVVARLAPQTLAVTGVEGDRALIEKAPPRKDRVDLNAAIREVIELARGEATKNDVSMRTQLADGLPLVLGDRVQLQQVVLNLTLNAVEAG